MNASPILRLPCRPCLETGPTPIQPRFFSPFHPRQAGDRVHTQLQQLKRSLLRKALEETPDAALFKRLCAAANDAADRAWETARPLLVLPCLFDELVQKVRREFQVQKNRDDWKPSLSKSSRRES
jgi:hypothetical protein